MLGAALIPLGLDPRRWLDLRQAPRFLRDRRRFRAAGGRIDRLTPILSDYAAEAGEARGHYFHQDLLVATLIQAAAPARHIDVGSRIDGFVAHLAAFREVEVLDVRPLRLEHSRISFLQRDLTRADDELREVTDSLSCLHALEHFGLGRYGDPIDPQGHLKGFSALTAMLKPGGMLYLSVPIGRAGVYFNAHRVFEPADPLAWASGRLDLVRFDYVDDDGALHTQQTVGAVPDLDYGCGIYSLRRIADDDR